MASPSYNVAVADDGMTKSWVKGTSGGANGKIEYIGKARPGTAKTATGWQVQKWTYDSGGFLTDIQFANYGEFNCVFNDYASLTYS